MQIRLTMRATPNKPNHNSWWLTGAEGCKITTTTTTTCQAVVAKLS